MTAEDIKAALTDRQALALTIWGEARAEALDGQAAVGCVVRNRLARPERFGRTWRQVCLRKLQFSCWWPQGGATNYAAVMAQAEAMVMHGRVPKPRSAMAHCLWVADGLLGDAVADITRGADHYLTSSLLLTKPPLWTNPPAVQTTTIGAHVFFRVA